MGMLLVLRVTNMTSSEDEREIDNFSLTSLLKMQSRKNAVMIKLQLRKNALVMKTTKTARRKES